MDKQYRLALLILLIPLMTLVASTLTFYLGYKPSEINANGIPLDPKIETKNFILVEEDGSRFIFKPGKWYFVYFDDFSNEDFSLDRYKIARSSKATLRRESHRLRRLVIYKDKEMFNEAESLKSKFPEVIFLYDEGDIFRKSISENLSDPYMSKSMFLVDSFALVVWEFNVGLSFSDIFEDLEQLL